MVASDHMTRPPEPRPQDLRRSSQTAKENDTALVEAVKEQTKSIGKLVGIVAALLAHIEGEQDSGEDRPAATYMDGTPKQ